MRELGIRKALLELPFKDRTMFTGKLNKRLLQQGPRGWHGVLAILLSPLVGQDLYEIGKALWDLSDLAQHVKRVCKVRGHPRGEESMVRRGRGLSELPEDKCGEIYADLKFLRKHC